MWAQETHRVLKYQQIRISIIYMHYLNTTCPPMALWQLVHLGKPYIEVPLATKPLWL